jgi:MerR family transcriptional regulator, copper efflux regulator
MQIHEIAQITGLTPATIRYYEHEGLLDKRHITRRSNGYRSYTKLAAELLLHFKQARAAGLTIADLKRLTAAFDAGKLTDKERSIFLQGKISDLSQKIAMLQELQKGFEMELRTLSARDGSRQISDAK